MGLCPMRFNSMKLLPTLLLAAAGCKGTNIVKVGNQTDTFVQKGKNAQSAVFNQKPGVIDILFVVDNSPSMCDKRARLSSDFSQFLAQLAVSNLDFHIGVVTTDMVSPAYSGRLVKGPAGETFLANTTPNLAAEFSGIIAAIGDNGSADSEPLLAGATALQPPLLNAANAGFVRSGAALAVVVVDDEDDYSLSLPPPPDGGQSVGSGTLSGDPMVFYFDRLYKGLKGPGDENLVSVSGIVGAALASDGGAVEPAACDVGDGGSVAACVTIDDDSSANAAYRLLAVVADTGGLGQSICQPDFNTILTNLGKLLGGLSSRFVINSGGSANQGGVFQASSITVTVTPPGGAAQPVPQDALAGWTYDQAAGAVEFLGTYLPPPGSTIEVDFASLNNTFKLSYPPVAGTLTVTVTTPGGTPKSVPTASADPVNGFTFDSASQSLVFPPANVPALGSTITASYDPS